MAAWTAEESAGGCTGAGGAAASVAGEAKAAVAGGEALKKEAGREGVLYDREVDKEGMDAWGVGGGGEWCGLRWCRWCSVR